MPGGGQTNGNQSRLANAEFNHASGPAIHISIPSKYEKSFKVGTPNVSMK